MALRLRSLRALRARLLHPSAGGLQTLFAVVLVLMLTVLARPAAAAERQALGAIADALRDYVRGLDLAIDESPQGLAFVLDERLNLPACQDIDVALAAGQSPGPRMRLRVRCDAPSPWTLFVSVRVKLQGAVTQTAVPASAVMAPAPRGGPVIQAGQTVRVVSRGQGFQVSAPGSALASAAEGRTVLVRTASGQTVSGIARAGAVVEVPF